MAGSPTGLSKAAALGDFLTLIGLALLMLHATTDTHAESVHDIGPLGLGLVIVGGFYGLRARSSRRMHPDS